MNETKAFRNEDRLNRCIEYLEANNNGNQRNTNIPKRKKIKSTKPFSTQKRQIQIFEAFKKIQDKPCTINCNLELYEKYVSNT